jgi:predicted membrane metal-binding protein
MIVANGVMAALAFLADGAPRCAHCGSTIALFVLVAGAGASAIRAGLMAGLGLFARGTGRTYDALRALIAVFVLMLLINPLSAGL